jgi:hypothetical protein
MRIPDEAREQLSMRFEVLMPRLNGRQRRLLLATVNCDLASPDSFQYGCLSQ